LFRENTGLDFGAWGHVLFTEDDEGILLYTKYKHFIFINSTVYGPYMPSYCSRNDWPQLFISKLNNNVKLVGLSINKYGLRGEPNPHVQSMVMATDRIGLDIAIKHKIFTKVSIQKNKHSIITQKEVWLSRLILQAGYNIACMMTHYNNTDFKTPFDKLHEHVSSEMCHNSVILFHPYETIFVKNYVYNQLRQFIQWQNSIAERDESCDLTHISKILYGISLEKSIDITQKIKDYITKSCMLNCNFNLNIFLGHDPFFGVKKQLFILLNNHQIESDKIESDKIESDKIESDKIESDKIESDKIESDKMESYIVINELSGTLDSHIIFLQQYRST
jgi:hypothetical protein